MEKKKFTFTDLLSLGIILVILGFLAIPHVKAARTRAREAEVITNMHTLQLTAEDFATLANGYYPTGLSITVEETCWTCVGDLRNIAENRIAPYGAESLLPDFFRNPFTSYSNTLIDDAGTGVSGRVNYFDFDPFTANAARGYSIRAVGADNTMYMNLVLISSR
jgi:hypothetical protein